MDTTTILISEADPALVAAAEAAGDVVRVDSPHALGTVIVDFSVDGATASVAVAALLSLAASIATTQAGLTGEQFARFAARAYQRAAQRQPTA